MVDLRGLPKFVRVDVMPTGLTDVVGLGLTGLSSSIGVQSSTSERPSRTRQTVALASMIPERFVEGEL